MTKIINTDIIERAAHNIQLCYNEQMRRERIAAGVPSSEAGDVSLLVLSTDEEIAAEIKTHRAAIMAAMEGTE